jgi:hypothetical protein
MTPQMGLLGVFLLALGGLMVSFSLGGFIRSAYNDVGNAVGNFSGFILFGLGLWLIVQSGRQETRPTPLNQH